MELTNNPDEGTGITVDEAANNIEKLLDSLGTTEKVDADEDDDVIDLNATDEDEAESDEEETLEESDEQEADAEEDAESKEEAKETDEKAGDNAEIVFEVDGKQISREEARQGYLRQSDYTKKTTELKQHMARYQVQQQDMSEMRVAVGNDLEKFKKTIAALVDPAAFEPPSDALYDEDPYEYGRRKMEYERRQDAIRQLWQAEQLNNEQNAKWEKEQFVIKQATARDEFAEKNREFADKQKAPALYTALGEFLYDNGFDIDEINGIADSRILDFAYRLYKAEQVQKQVAKVVPHFEKKPKMATPGVAKATSAARGEASAQNLKRLKQTGSLNDAEAWAMSILQGK